MQQRFEPADIGKQPALQKILADGYYRDPATGAVTYFKLPKGK
jgi:hypothetical protein